MFLAFVTGDNTVAEDVSIGDDAGDIDDKLGFTDDNDAPTELVGLSELLSLTDLQELALDVFLQECQHLLQLKLP